MKTACNGHGSQKYGHDWPRGNLHFIRSRLLLLFGEVIHDLVENIITKAGGLEFQR